MKALIVEDHALFREALRGVVEMLGATEVMEARTFEEGCCRMAEEPTIDLALLDLHLPDRHGLDVVREVRRRHPAVPLVVVSADEDPCSMRDALDAGAMGYIPKSASREVILQALGLVLAGEVFVPRHVLDAMPAPSLARLPREVQLSTRQRDLAELLAQGFPNREIARRLGIAEATVKAHLTRIFQVLGVENRAQAALAAKAILARVNSESALPATAISSRAAGVERIRT